MPTLAVSDSNIVCAVLGGFITLFALVSYICKERFYLSETLISFIAGLTFSPHALNLIRPLDYAGSSTADLGSITLYFSRLVLDIQLVIAGVQLPARYLRTQWRPLSILVLVAMCGMWLITALLMLALIPQISFTEALVVAACVTPTDPVLSNNIVKGKFADKNIPVDLQRIIVAEAGTNDGLGYPFLYLPLYILRYSGSPRTVAGLWFGEILGYTILLSIVYGAAVGWLAKELLRIAKGRGYVDRETFPVFAITLAIFIVGTAGMIGSDDVLACFIAGNTFTWDDRFRLETLDDSLQPTIDMLLNVVIFAWYGAVCPWTNFGGTHADMASYHAETGSFFPIATWRLAVLGLLILLSRRLPIVLALYRTHLIPQMRNLRHAFFVGYFGPIGVSGIFYLYIARDFLQQSIIDNPLKAPSDVAQARRLSSTLETVVWFMATCSIIGFGISVPLGKVGLRGIDTLYRTVKTSISHRPASTWFRPIRSRQVGRA